MKSSLFAAALVLGLAISTGVAFAGDKTDTPTGAATPPAAATPAVDPTAKAPEEAKRMARDAEIVCFNDLDTGSHLKRTRVCMTRAQRDQRQKEGGDAMDALKDAGRTPAFAPSSAH